MFDLMPQILSHYRLARGTASRPEIRRVVSELSRNGVAIMQSAAPHQLVAAALRDMDRLVRNMPELQGTAKTIPRSTGGVRDRPVHEYNQDLKVYRSFDPLMFSPAYARFLLLPELIEVSACYLGRRWFYQSMTATRTDPIEPTRKGLASWHHDARGHKLNVFLLLTDVPADGPATIVLTGSHELLHARCRRERNFFVDEEVAAIKRSYNYSERICHAPAGSLVFFDAQALHLGRRSLQRRDAFQVNCMTRRRHVWSHEIPRTLLSSLARADQSQLVRRADLRRI
jgi:hypothetical protein